MSRINRLQVQGIRSFGPDQPQQIKFTPPLTLILGQNGCGKTTIIEALKYITTGEMPPGCGRGASFIHDPKISREMAVRGQIKLRVITAMGERVDFVRSMEVVQRPKTLEFKSLDQTITRTGPDGQKRHVSSKCADFLWESLNVIGVSKPILENVIFCHQEESNWPLDESKKVKDKFDAIFNATRYIKCLDAMRKLRLEKKHEIKSMTENLALLRDIKEEADRKRAELVTHKEQIEQIKLEQEEIINKKKPILKRIKEIEEYEHSIAKISQDLGRKENRIAMLEENNNNDLAEQTHSLDCSDDELHRKIMEYETTLSLKKTQIRKEERSIGEVTQDLKLLSTRQAEAQKCLTKLETEQEQHEGRVARRNQKISQLVTEGSIPALRSCGVNGGYTESEAQNCIQSVAEHVQQQQELLETRESEMLATEEALQTSINSLRSREAALMQEVRGLDDRVARLEQQKRQCSAELRKLEKEVQLCDTEALKTQIADLDQKLLCKEQSFDETKSLRELEELKQRRTSLTRQVGQIKDQLVEMNKMAAARSELDVHNKEIQDMSKKITQLFHQCRGTLERILPSTVTEESLKTDYDVCYKNLQKSVNANKIMLETLREKRSKHQVSVDTLRQQKIEKEKEIKSLEEKISDMCPDMPLEEAIQRKKEQLEALQRESGELESTQTVMERYVEKLTVEDCCPLCHRDFAAKDENLALRDELRSRLSNLPLRLKSAKSRLLAAEKQYSALQQLEPFREQLQDAQAKLRNIQSDLSRPVSELSRVKEEMDDCEANLSLYESEVSMCQSVHEDVVAADTMRKARSKLAAKCDGIKAKLGDEGSNESLEEVNNRLSALEQQQREVTGLLEDAQTQFMADKDELLSLRESRNTLAARQIEMETKQQAVQKKREEATRLQDELQKERASRDECSQRVGPAKEAVKEKQAEKNAATTKRMQFSNSERAQIEAVRNVLRPLEELQASIAAFISSNSEARIATSRQDLERLRREEQAKQRLKEEHEANLRSLEKELLNEREYERSLNTEKKIRERKREIDDLRKEVQILKDNISSAQEESLTVEKSRLNKEYIDLDKKLNSNQGRADEVNKRVRELEKTLHLPQFKDAVKKYREKLLLIKCTEMACEDLNKYYKALDTAIMRFHTEKMTAINRIIHQLWNVTYKGNDVDKIEIKTDETESKGADRRRTYNYRVVMHKKDVELDMRGRCSAGQKVLASLIIRMALAETFSKNCGILALDEPTTNLDRENIRSLVDSLVGIVNQRSAQRNFQLIVITHDDEFLHGLTEVDQIKEYYQVQRDERGFSCLKRVELEQARR